ncbi:MAG: hypothetical protein ACE141_14560 [Bryobacteraceae bacterium]
MILEHLAQEATRVSQTARKHRRPLKGAGFYATKLAGLRTDAEIQLRALPGGPENKARLRTLIDTVFGPDSSHTDRVDSMQAARHELRTEWSSCSATARADDGLFPIALLEKTHRGYLRGVGEQMNGAFNSGWCDAAAVMMRRLLETAIIEAFEANGLDAKIKNSNGDFLQLTDLVQCALSTWNLGRDTKKGLPKLKDVGHWSAHNRRYMLQKPELEQMRSAFRLALEELLHLAKLI